MAGRTTYSKRELDDLRERLAAEREELQAQLTTIEEQSFANSQSDISGEVSFDEENADAGTFTFERERDLSIENNVRDLLGKVDRALTRMDEGGYGRCSRCGKPIEKGVLPAERMHPVAFEKAIEHPVQLTKRTHFLRRRHRRNFTDGGSDFLYALLGHVTGSCWRIQTSCSVTGGWIHVMFPLLHGPSNRRAWMP